MADDAMNDGVHNMGIGNQPQNPQYAQIILEIHVPILQNIPPLFNYVPVTKEDQRNVWPAFKELRNKYQALQEPIILLTETVEEYKHEAETSVECAAQARIIKKALDQLRAAFNVIQPLTVMVNLK